MAGARVAVASAAIGLALGTLLLALTNLVANQGPHADSWSLRGNGALVVPFGLGLPILSAGSAALLLRAREHAHWLRWGLLATLVAVVPALFSVLALIAFDSVPLSSWASLPTLGLCLLIPLGAALMPIRRRPPAAPEAGRKRPDAWPGFAIIAFPVSVVAGFALAERLLPT